MADEEKPPQLKDDNSAPDDGSNPQASADAEAKEAAQKALEESKELLNKGVAGFKSLDLFGQIYLAGLAVFVVCSLIFSCITYDWDADGAVSEYTALTLKKMKDMSNDNAPQIVDASLGKLALVAALAGIGIFIWNLLTPKKAAWAPLALIACAALPVLTALLIMFNASDGSTDSLGLSGGITLDIDMTMLGFWLPLAGAVAATVVAVKKVTRA